MSTRRGNKEIQGPGPQGRGSPHPSAMDPRFGNTNPGEVGPVGPGSTYPGAMDIGFGNANPVEVGPVGPGSTYPDAMNPRFGNTNPVEVGPVGPGSTYPGAMNLRFENTNPAELGPVGPGSSYHGAISPGYGHLNTGEARAVERSSPCTPKMDSSYSRMNKREFEASGSESGMETDSEFEKQFKEIKRLLNCAESQEILSQVKGEDIVIFIGNTKSGKSTLVNYAISNQLKAVKMDDFPFTMTIVKANENEKGPLISLEPVSETTFPSIWSASKSGLNGKIVDAPGFEDNRGEAQDIANTFYIKQIMRAAKSVKFVLNTDLNDIVSQNINNFTNFIDKMHRIFSETRVLHGGIALVFSKGSSVYSSSDICNFFKKNILDQQEMHVEKSLIQYFVEHEECIAFFEMPCSEGIIRKANIADNGIIDVIENKLKGIPGTALTDVQSGVSDKSKVFLLQSQAELCNQGQYFDLLQSVKDAFTKMAIEIYKSESTDRVKEIDEYLMSLYTFVYQMVPPAGGKFNLEYIVLNLSALCNKCGIQNLMDQSNIAIQVQFVEFLDEILRLNNSTIYIAKFQSTLEIIKKDIYEARIFAATKLKKITEEEAERQRRDVMEKHNVGMEQLLQVINTQTMANNKSVEDQLKSLGVLDMIVLTGKKILTTFFPQLNH